MQGWLSSYMALLITLFIFNMMPGLLEGLKDVEIIVPRYVRQGSDVKLSCKYDLQEMGLYAVKWYKGLPFKEFYRYLPKEAPPALAFHLAVNVTLSNDREVFLKNASLEMSGLYKCSVAAEFPFETLEDSSEMRVVVIEDAAAPILRLDRTQYYYLGDQVKAECQSPASFPPANISFYLNDVKIEHGRISKTEIVKDVKRPMVQSKVSVSTISFDLPEIVAPVRIFCRATVLSIYDQKSNTTTLQLIPRRLTGTETLSHSGSSRASKDSIATMLLGLVECLYRFVLIAFPSRNFAQHYVD